MAGGVKPPLVKQTSALVGLRIELAEVIGAALGHERRGVNQLLHEPADIRGKHFYGRVLDPAVRAFVIGHVDALLAFHDRTERVCR